MLFTAHICIHIWRHTLKFLNKQNQIYKGMHANRHTYTHAYTHMVCSLHLAYSGGAPTCPQISVKGIFWHRKKHHQYTGFLQLDEGTHTLTHTQHLPFCKSTHSQMRHILNLSSRAVREIKQGKRRPEGLVNTCPPKSLTNNLYCLCKVTLALQMIFYKRSLIRM